VKTLIARCALPAAAALIAGTAFGGNAAPAGSGNDEYRVVHLDTLGGSESQANSINNIGLVTGYSGLEGNQYWHASLWLYGLQVDLGTLGDANRNSNVPWPAKNNRGLIVGISQTNTPEPLGQLWSCRSFFPFATRSGFTCLPFVWEHGRMRSLPTLGGYNGFATGANNHKQIVGWAEKLIEEPTCNTQFQRLQFRAVMWGPGKNQKRELKPLGTDPTSAATALNDKGQVVGISGDCGTAVGGVAARNALIWEKGKYDRPRPIGSLGGIAWNTPMAINEHGVVVGFSNINESDGAGFFARAFIWDKHRGMRGLGVLPGTDVSQALGINNRGQVVGTSCTADFTVCKGFLWENDRLMDMNDLVPDDYEHTIATAGDINDAGRIVGGTVLADGTGQVAFYAIPTGRSHGHDDHAAGLGKSRPPMVLPADLRRQIMSRIFVEERDLVRR
jgi:probable HAF family extracellular repeat protein